MNDVNAVYGSFWQFLAVSGVKKFVGDYNKKEP